MKVKKICDEPVKTCCLGEGSKMERELLQNGGLRRLENGGYEVFSQEAVNGKGERAEEGDFIKLDQAGQPYPNKRDFFLANHTERGGRYYQIPRVMEAWDLTMPTPDEIRFLLDSGRLTIDESDPEHTFRAKLWGAPLSAASDAVILFHKVRYEADGRIADLSFHFIAREEFEKTYRSCEPAE